jgi:hypothetical protein
MLARVRNGCCGPAPGPRIRRLRMSCRSSHRAGSSLTFGVTARRPCCHLRRPKEQVVTDVVAQLVLGIRGRKIGGRVAPGARNNVRETALPIRSWGSFMPPNGVGGGGVHCSVSRVFIWKSLGRKRPSPGSSCPRAAALETPFGTLLGPVVRNELLRIGCIELHVGRRSAHLQLPR